MNIICFFFIACRIIFFSSQLKFRVFFRQEFYLYLELELEFCLKEQHISTRRYIAVKKKKSSIWVMAQMDIFSFILDLSIRGSVCSKWWIFSYRWCLITRRKSRVSTKRSQQKQNSPLIKTRIRTTSRLTFLQYHPPG